MLIIFQFSRKHQLFLFSRFRPSRNLILKRVKRIFEFMFNNNFNVFCFVYDLIFNFSHRLQRSLVLHNHFICNVAQKPDSRYS